MVDFTSAAVTALKRNDKFDFYFEYEHLYLFLRSDAEESFGGWDAPVLIEKETGEIISHAQLADEGKGDWLNEDKMINRGSIVQRLAEERPMSPQHQARYTLEHQLIPHLLYNEAIGFMLSIVKQEKNILFEILSELLEKDGIENPYAEDQLKIDPFKIEDILVAKIIFPEPEEEPLCYQSFVFFNTKTKEAAYYCLEKGGTFDDEPFLCGWSREGVHLNYGNCGFDEEELIVNMLRLFLDPNGEKTPQVEVSFNPKASED